MAIFINATGSVSPQPASGRSDLLSQVRPIISNRLNAEEPDYKKNIDPKLLRRMSRIIRMGVAAAIDCLEEGKTKAPDAIITGTAYGCLQDTDTFLSRMVEYREELLTPTAFIQSTHNTVGAQISLMLQCKNYNNTFVHRGFSFESALLDAMMLVEEETKTNALVGAVDEITETSHTILTRMGLYKPENYSGSLIDSGTRGTVAGEAATFFLLSGEQNEQSYCRIKKLDTFYKPLNETEVNHKLGDFLENQNVDLLIIGKNGDADSDKKYDSRIETSLSNIPSITYKQLCGEYPTSGAFATWLAANIISRGEIPPTLPITGSVKTPIQNILIYNNYFDIHHSLILLTAC